MSIYPYPCAFIFAPLWSTRWITSFYCNFNCNYYLFDHVSLVICYAYFASFFVIVSFICFVLVRTLMGCCGGICCFLIKSFAIHPPLLSAFVELIAFTMLIWLIFSCNQSSMLTPRLWYRCMLNWLLVNTQAYYTSKYHQPIIPNLLCMSI